ncbi:putative protein phosphatase 2C 66 [Apostasia shenzhenica]|uniref:protein-serine/threonine phosphatase n=1 Tax=Apostasia shenzhenica TaxID=1088818 RepID=A0A2I0A4N0_9ASPA|nr:putative protein phosphatase 2C 66 [Apostasia shenzhenica]
MGLCMSSRAPAVAATAAGAPISGEGGLSGSSGLTIKSKRWREWKKKGSEEEKKKGRGLFDWKASVSGGKTEAVEEDLRSVPGRMFQNGVSKVACLFTQQGKKGINQDAMIVWENFTLGTDTIFCGVFDGHGPFGHLIAKKVRDSLPLKLSAQWKAVSSEEASVVSLDDEQVESVNEQEDVNLPEMYLPLKQSLLHAFKLMDKELKLLPTVDCFCSGTTAVALVKQEQDLIIANLGDSRAVLATRDKGNSLIALQLTVDLKPNLPKEAARIQQCKGRVFALQDEPEVGRVWLPNCDSPGLAMARAFGDFCLKDYGLISVPDISYHRLSDKDEFVVLATDGVWDALSNKEVVDIVSSAPTRAVAARELVECAVRAWQLKFPTSKIDDCAAVCLFLDPPPSSFLDQELVETDKNSRKIRSSEEIVPLSEEPKEEKVHHHRQSTRSLAECISNAEDDEWSALEGVTRVNSLLNLPRSLSSDEQFSS